MVVTAGGMVMLLVRLVLANAESPITDTLSPMDTDSRPDRSKAEVGIIVIRFGMTIDLSEVHCPNADWPIVNVLAGSELTVDPARVTVFRAEHRRNAKFPIENVGEGVVVCGDKNVIEVNAVQSRKADAPMVWMVVYNSTVLRLVHPLNASLPISPLTDAGRSTVCTAPQFRKARRPIC
jgi:hypothetical protein